MMRFSPFQNQMFNVSMVIVKDSADIIVYAAEQARVDPDQIEEGLLQLEMVFSQQFILMDDGRLVSGYDARLKNLILELDIMQSNAEGINAAAVAHYDDAYQHCITKGEGNLWSLTMLESESPRDDRGFRPIRHELTILNDEVWLLRDMAMIHGAVRRDIKSGYIFK